MRILTSLSAVDLGGIAIPADIHPDLYKEIGDCLKNAYYSEQTDGHELDLSDDSEDYTTPGKFIFGITDPKTILHVSAGWNDIFKENLLSACKQVLQTNTTNMLPNRDKIQLHTSAIHRLHIAACHADNDVTASAPQAVYLENVMGFPYFKTLLSNEDMQHIKNNPERYLLVNINLPEI